MANQWITPALLVSLLFLLAVVSFGLLAELHGSRAELQADFRELKQEVRAKVGEINTRRDAMDRDLKRHVDAMGADLNHRMDGLSAEVKAGRQELNSRMDRLYQLYQRLAAARQPDLQT